MILPVDGRVARTFAAGAPYDLIALNGDTSLEADQMVLDAGDAAVVEIVAAFETLKTLIWNGPLGAFEIAPFDTATVAAAQAAAKLTREGALVTVAGGGDTELPGVAALS